MKILRHHFPFRFMVKRYHDVYHLQYRHAKKLFVFDISLILCMVALVIGTSYWFFYTPERSVGLLMEITPSTQKIKSGEEVTLTISYLNVSESILGASFLKINLPENFVVDDLNDDTITVPLGNIPISATGSFAITGHYFHTPEKNIRFESQIDYTLKNKNHTTRAVAILTARGSVLDIGYDIPRTIVSGTNTPIEITIDNTGDTDIAEVIFPREIGKYVTLSIPETSNHSRTLSSKEKRIIPGSIRVNAPRSISSTLIHITPQIRIGETLTDHSIYATPLEIIHTGMTLTGRYVDVEHMSQGERIPIELDIRNTGNTPLENISIKLPLDQEIFDIPKIRKSYHVIDGSIVITADTNPLLSTLTSGNTITVHIDLYTKKVLSTTKNSHIQTLLVEGKPENNSNTVTEEIQLNELTIDRNPYSTARALYYSTEGDQLGRGPLPPQVGRETRYWLILETLTGSTALRIITITETLANGISWTGKSGIRTGKSPVYDEKTNTLLYTVRQLEPDYTLPLSVELMVTPTTTTLGKHIDLTKKIHIRTEDINGKIWESQLANITTELVGDTIGRQYGTVVVEQE
jgi:hypothetical protein